MRTAHEGRNKGQAGRGARRAGLIVAVIAAAGTATSPAFAQAARPTPVPAPERPSTRPMPAPGQPSTRPTPTPAPERPSTGPMPIAPAPGQPVPPSTMPAPAPAPRPTYFAGSVKCESKNNKSRTCSARYTEGRVEIVQVHGGSCVRNRSFTYTNDSITVTSGCRATFAYGYGNHRPKASSKSSALPWMLAGAGATAGMVALINSGDDDKAPEARPAPPPEPAPAPAPAPEPAPPSATQPPFPALPPARIEANTQFLTADQQRSMQTCLLEGARQTGITGGSVFRFDAMESIEQGSGGWRFRFRATTTHPDRQRQFSIFCRATPSSIVEFSVTPVALAQAQP